MIVYVLYVCAMISVCVCVCVCVRTLCVWVRGCKCACVCHILANKREDKLNHELNMLCSKHNSKLSC